MSEFGIEEYKESYAHYRHLEVLRSHQVTTFIALVGGVGTVTAFLLQGKNLLDMQNADVLIPASFFTAGLQILAIFTLGALRRLGEARLLHEGIIGAARKRLGDMEIIEMVARFDHTRTKWLSVQGSGEALVHGISALIVVGLWIAWMGAMQASSFATLMLVVVPPLLWLYQLFVHYKLSPSKSV